MVRTQIYLSDVELAALDRVAGETGVTRSQLVRDAVDARYLAAPTRTSIERALKASAGAWRTSARVTRDGAQWAERLRRGRLAKKLDRAR